MLRRSKLSCAAYSFRGQPRSFRWLCSATSTSSSVGATATSTTEKSRHQPLSRHGNVGTVASAAFRTNRDFTRSCWTCRERCSGSRRYFSKTTAAAKEVPETLQTVAQWIQESEDTCQQNILVLCGAGVSVAAGIPDFRSPGTGLYDNLQKYSLPFPEAVFDLEYFQQSPQAFLSLARDIWPGMIAEHSPTLTHSFLGLLEEKKVMLRCYTQNIDGLEYLAGVPAERLVECHGHFRTSSCTNCGAPADINKVKECVLGASPEPPLCEQCQTGYVKPDIVFFGEMLPERVSWLLGDDLEEAGLLLILGTSLTVAPVSMIPDSVQPHCRRVLLNREYVGNLDIDRESQQENDPRDLFHAGDCDESVLAICRSLGWEDDLLERNKEARIGGRLQ